MTAAEISQKPPPTQVAILLHCGGPEALEVYNTFTFAEGEDRNNMETVISKYHSRKNIVFERYPFWQRNQLEDEPVDHQITDLKTKPATCEFGEERDNMIRDKIVSSISERSIKARMLREANLTLEKAVDLCHAAEASKVHLKTMVGRAGEKASVNVINKNMVGNPTPYKQKYTNKSCIHQLICMYRCCSRHNRRF